MLNKKYMPLYGIAALALMISGIGWLSVGYPKTGEDLLGMSYSEVIEVLGVPDSIGVGCEHEEFWYPSENGKCEVKVWFHDNCVIWVKPGLKISGPCKPVPDSGFYAGQPIEDMVRKNDQPVEMISSQINVTVCYKDGKEVDIARGMVLHVRE